MMMELEKLTGILTRQAMISFLEGAKAKGHSKNGTSYCLARLTPTRIDRLAPSSVRKALAVKDHNKKNSGEPP